MKKIILLIMTRNEIDGIKEIFPRIDKKLFSKVLVVDGFSNDGTVEWLEKNSVEVFRQERAGIRYGMIDGLNSIQESYDFVITFSPDGNSNPEALIEMCDHINQGNSRIYYASRYFNGGKSDDDDFVTAFGNWLFTKLINLIFNGNLTDAMVIYRAFDSKIINDLCLTEEQSYSFFERMLGTNIGWEPLMSVRAAKYKVETKDFYAKEGVRIGGERKLQVIRWGLAFFGQLLRETWYKPKLLITKYEKL
jgi:glycosyltransferase involved in cell wall biosynthesis